MPKAPPKPKNPLLKVREEDIQQQIVEGLSLYGYIVLQTTVRGIKARCKGCGSELKAYGGYGADKGVPDLLVSRTDWMAGVWVGLEVKSETGRLKPEQAELLAQNRIHVVRSFDEAKSIVDAYRSLYRPKRMAVV